MEEFNDLQDLWRHQDKPAPLPKTDLTKIKSNRMKIRNNFLKGAALLVFTAILIQLLMIYLDADIKTPLVIASMIGISLICMLQAILMIFNANQITKIDETQTPEKHLKQWQKYQEFQKSQRHWNMPVYFLLLGVTITLYLFEILKNADAAVRIICIGATYGWMAFAYFYLGKKEIKRHDTKIDGIISGLKNLENQFR